MTITTVQTDIPRDRFGRPLVVPLAGGSPIPYTRCTTYIDCLEDRYKLEEWKCRMTAIGITMRDDLRLSTAAHFDDKNKLNAIVQDAMEVAKSHEAANIGTALHALCAQMDLGQTPEHVPAEYHADLAHLKIGGTPDRVVRYQGKDYIADIKTGQVEYGMAKIAMQLSIYSRCVLYDHMTQERTPLSTDFEKGLLIHLPAGTGTCTLHWVDLNAGWRGVQLAEHVRKWRTKDRPANFRSPFGSPDPIAKAIRAAKRPTDLIELWRKHNGNGWTQTHTDLAAEVKAVLTAI
jgi:hypothetical protein